MDNTLKEIELPSYIVIDACPSDLTESSCSLGKELLDLLFVSDIRDGRTYRNRKCAECNNVYDVVTWQLSILCIDENAVVRQSSNQNELSKVILEQCHIRNIPPPELENDIRLYECLSDAVSWCNNTNFHNEDLAQQCETIDPSHRHIFFLNKVSAYQNHYCYACNNPTVPPKKVCSERAKANNGLAVSFFTILDHDYFEKKATGKCKLHQVYDPFAVGSFLLSNIYVFIASFK